MEILNSHISKIDLANPNWLFDFRKPLKTGEKTFEKSPIEMREEIESWFLSVDEKEYNQVDQRQLHILANHAYFNFGKQSFFENLNITRETKDQILFHLWLHGALEYCDLERWKGLFRELIPDLQAWFIKRYFNLVHKGKTSFDINFLKQWVTEISSGSEVLMAIDRFDLSTRVILEAIFNYESSNYLASDSRIFDLVFTKLNIEQELFRFDTFFDKCLGRSIEIKGEWRADVPFKSYHAINEGEKYFFLKKPNIKTSGEELIASGWKFNDKSKTWYIGKEQVSTVDELAKNKGYVIWGESIKIGPNNLIQMERVERFTPKNLSLCEGHLHHKKHDFYGCDKWLCRGGYCFENSVAFKKADDWINYSLIDFLVLSGLESKFPKDIYGKQRKKYFDFIGWINRFNDAMDHIACRECNRLMRPAEGNSPEAIYRTTKFSCTNNNCSVFGEVVTLTHCFNQSCQATIDSRDSNRCPHGLLICRNENCGCCCGEKNRYDRNTRERIKGHFESMEHFCYKCGDKMNEKEPHVYECNSKLHEDKVSYKVGFWEARVRDISEKKNDDFEIDDLPF